jgi:hypothetical protein
MERFRVCAASLLPCALYVCVTLGPTPFTRSHKRILGTWRHFVVPCPCCAAALWFRFGRSFVFHQICKQVQTVEIVSWGPTRWDKISTRLICIRLYSTVLMGLMVFFPYYLIAELRFSLI